MKKVLITVLIPLIAVSALPTAVIAGTGRVWVGSVAAQRSINGGPFSAAVSRFEGLLRVYASETDANEGNGSMGSGRETILQMVESASQEIGRSLAELTAEIVAVYPELTKEEQTSVLEAYVTAGAYLQNLADEATFVFEREGNENIAFAVVQGKDIGGAVPSLNWADSF